MRGRRQTKGTGTKSGKSATGNLEPAGSMRSRAESTGGWVNLKEQGTGAWSVVRPRISYERTGLVSKRKGSVNVRGRRGKGNVLQTADTHVHSIISFLI